MMPIVTRLKGRVGLAAIGLAAAILAAGLGPIWLHEARPPTPPAHASSAGPPPPIWLHE